MNCRRNIILAAQRGRGYSVQAYGKVMGIVARKIAIYTVHPPGNVAGLWLVWHEAAEANTWTI